MCGRCWSGALGCNLAWGIIDGILYLMGCMAEKGRNLATYLAVRSAPDPATAQGLIAGALPPTVAGVLQPAELESIHLRLMALPDRPTSVRLDKDDFLGAIAVFLLVFLSTFPVAIPFIVMSDARPAMRASNLVAVALLFVTGVAFGRITGRQPIGVGLATVVLGAALVGMTMAMGG